MYAITVNVEYTQTSTTDGIAWNGSYGLPTFYLDERVQGITSEDHAKIIAHGIVDHMPGPANRSNVKYHITAVEV